MLSHPRCLLLVDDDPDIREAMTFVLESAGYRVQTATNGFEAIERLRVDEAPCLILLDLMMPVMNGWEFRAEQTRDPKLAAIPLVVVTGAGQAAQKAASLGATGVLEKPVELDVLLSVVERYCATGSE
jgi:CheY-like chemotaxis protein